MDKLTHREQTVLREEFNINKMPYQNRYIKEVKDLEREEVSVEEARQMLALWDFMSTDEGVLLIGNPLNNTNGGTWSEANL